LAAYDLGTARGKIEIDASTLGRTSAALQSVGKAMIGVGLVALAGFGIAVKSAADFEQQLSRFKAVTDTPTKAMEAVRQKALQLGRDSAFGAQEVVQGFVELGKAGLTAQDILRGVGDAAVDLAGAGELDMARSTEILVNAMRTFKLPAEQATHVADLLAGAANASTSEVDDLAVSLRYAGPVAAAAGISIEDLSTVLAIFANVGIKGSTAGTTLRGILLGLAAPSAKATGVMKELGIVTKDGANILFDATGKIKPLGEVFQILKEKTAGLNQAQRISAFNSIFQRRAISGAVEAALQGKDGFAAMSKQIGNVTAHEVLKTKLDNLSGSLKILKSSIETMLISAGSPIQKTLKQWVDRIRDVVNAFAKLSPQTLSLITNILAITGVILVLGGSFLYVVGKAFAMYRIIKDLIAATKLLVGVLRVLGLSFLTNPVFLVIAALVLLGIAFYLLYTRVKGFREFIDAVWQGLQTGAKAVWHVLEPILGAIGDAFVAIWEKAQPVVKALVAFFENTVGPKLSKIFDTIAKHWRIFVSVFLGPIGLIIANFETLKSVVETVFGFIADHSTVFAGIFIVMLGPIGLLIGAIMLLATNWSEAWGMMEDVANGAMDIFEPFWDVIAGSFILPMLKSVWDTIKQVISGTLDIIQGLLDIFIGIFTGDWSMVWAGLKEVVAGAWRIVLALVRNAFNYIIALFKTAGKLIPLVWSLAWRALKAVVVAVWNAIFGVLRGVVTTIFNILKGGVSLWVKTVTGAFKGLVRLVSTIVTGLFKALVSGVKLLGSGVVNGLKLLLKALEDLPHKVGFAIGFLLGFFITLPARIAGYLTEAISAIISWGAQVIPIVLQAGLNIVTAIGTWLIQLPGMIGNWLLGAINTVIEWAGLLAVQAAQAGSSFVSNVINFLLGLPGQIWGILVTAFNFITTWVQMAVAKAIEFGVNFVNSAVRFVASLPGIIGGALANVITTIARFVTDAVSRASDFGLQFFSAIIGFISDLPGQIGRIMDKIIDVIKGAIRGAFNAVKDFASGLWEGFKSGIFGSPRTKIEYAIEDMVANVAKGIVELKTQMRTINALGATFPSHIPIDTTLAVGAGAIKAPVVPATPTVNVATPPSSQDQIQIDVSTDADPEEIARALTFARRLR
jgi:TP901 family phage tail tape measure protein